MGVRVGDGSWFNHSLVGELCQFIIYDNSHELS